MPKPQIINPPNRLKSKVSMGGPGAVDPERLARAEAVIEQMTANYLDWVEADLKKLDNDLASLTPGGDDGETVDRIYRTSHDIKGQGGSFGYQLMTEVGALMCRYIENLNGNSLTREDIELMTLCQRSMRAVITGRLAGDGGEAGQRVLKGLSKVADKVKAATGT